ncbi:hypothetical protein HDU97_004904 [Phlyctochytrium planicorne]|nr:hypothetical protein HDU97_004904 [Phlyctochytrium planicorne]
MHPNVFSLFRSIFHHRTVRTPQKENPSEPQATPLLPIPGNRIDPELTTEHTKIAIPPTTPTSDPQQPLSTPPQTNMSLAKELCTLHETLQALTATLAAKSNLHATLTDTADAALQRSDAAIERASELSTATLAAKQTFAQTLRTLHQKQARAKASIDRLQSQVSERDVVIKQMQAEVEDIMEGRKWNQLVAELKGKEVEAKKVWKTVGRWQERFRRVEKEVQDHRKVLEDAEVREKEIMELVKGEEEKKEKIDLENAELDERIRDLEKKLLAAKSNGKIDSAIAIHV